MFILHKINPFDKMIERIKYFFERNGFEVCSRLGDFLGMRKKNIRLFFIYISFFTFGLSFAGYLILAFLYRIKDLVWSKRTSVFDL